MYLSISYRRHWLKMLSYQHKHTGLRIERIQKPKLTAPYQENSTRVSEQRNRERVCHERKEER